MSTMAETVMRGFYRNAEGDPQRLPWHRDAPGRVVSSALAARHGRGRTLDVGCGDGTFSVFLAQRETGSAAPDLFVSTAPWELWRETWQLVGARG